MRYISLIMAVLMFLGTGCLPVSYAAEEEPFKTYLYDNFEGITVGRHPLYREDYWYTDNLKVNYCGYIGVEKQNGNKVLRIYSKGKGEGIGSTSPSISAKINVVDRNFIISGKYMCSDTTFERGLMFWSPAGSNSIFRFQNGMLSCSGKNIMPYEANKWYDITLEVNARQNTVNITVDGVRIEDISLSVGIMGNSQEIRYYISGNQQNGAVTSFYLDDIKIYEGDTPLGEEAFANHPANLGLTDHTDLTTFLKGNMTVVNGKTAAAFGLERTELTYPAIFREGDVLVCAKDVMRFLNCKYAYENGSITFQLNNNSYRIDYTDGLCAVNGKLYISLEKLKNKLFKRFTVSDEGVAMFGDSAVYFNNDEQAAKMISYVLNTKEENDLDETWYPTREQIKADFESHTARQHPRVLATKDDFDRIRRELKTDPYLPKWYKAMKDKADSYLSAEPYTFRTTDGVRMDIQTVLYRFEALGLVYNVEGGQEYFNKAYEDMKAIVEYKSWMPEGYILLSNMLAAMSLAYDWFYHAMTPEQRNYIAKGMMEKGLQHALNGYRRDTLPGANDLETRSKLQWLADQSNWTAIGNGDNVMGAIALYDEYPEECLEIIESAFPSMENFWATTAPDGGNVEGVGYWEYAMIHYINYIAAMETALGTDYGRFHEGGIEKSGYFPIYMQNEMGAFNFSDSWVTPIHSPLFMYYALRNKDSGMGILRRDAIENGQSSPTLYDILWYRADLFEGDAIEMPLDAYFRNVESGSFRDAFNNEFSTFFSFHGGANYANHSHADSGAFVLYADGQRWIEDLGRDELTYTNLGGIQFQKDELYRIRTEGHNCVVINPDTSAGQPGYFAPVVRFETQKNAGLAVVDLTNAYYTYVEDYKRGYMLTDNRTRAVVQDKIKMKKPSDFYWFAHTAAQVEISDDGRSAVLTKNGRKLLVCLRSPDDNLKLDVMNAEPLPTSVNIRGQADNSGYRKLFIKAQGVMETEFAVSFLPISRGEEVPKSVGKFVELEKWNITENTETAEEKTVEILFDGVVYGGFNPHITEYNNRLAYGKTIPNITARVSEGSAATIESNDVEGGTESVITITDGEQSKKYYFTFKSAALQGLPEELTEHFPVSASASEVIQEQYPPENLIDGSIDNESRWSGLDDQWLLFDLGEEKTITDVSLSLMNAAARISKFEVYTSNDGESFDLVASCQSSRTTSDYETYKLKQSTARYVKIQLHGADVSRWNSVREVKIFGK